MIPTKITGLTDEQWAEARELFKKQYGEYPDHPGRVGTWADFLEAKFLYEETAREAVEQAMAGDKGLTGVTKEQRREQSEAAIQKAREEQAAYEAELFSEISALEEETIENTTSPQCEEPEASAPQTLLDETFDFGF